MFFYQVDGKFTLNENICDVDGLNVVSDAMLSLPHAPNDLVYLPNNPYNPQQLFFINAAQVRKKAIPKTEPSPVSKFAACAFATRRNFVIINCTFFLRSFQSYCSHLGPVSYVLYLELDEHSPNPER